MPTCRIHRGQLKISSWCRAPLPCGSECGRLCEWKFHGFQLCLDHLEHPMTCYFLKIPIEMRLRIYQFLLPDKSIPVRCGNSSLTSDGGGVYTAILCVNHQIHDEAAGLLYIKPGEAVPAQFLLRPFRRLHNVAKLEVLSITMQDFQDGEIELLIPGWNSTPTGRIFAAYLECLFKDMSNPQPLFELPVFKAYWQLEKLLSRMKEHYHHADPEIGQFADLLHVARTAREAEDLTRFRVIWERVVDIWFDYLNHQKEFQSNVALSIDAIYGVVKNGS